MKLAILEPGWSWVGERFKQKETNKEEPRLDVPPTWEKGHDWGTWSWVQHARFEGSRGSRGSRGSVGADEGAGGGSNQGFCAAAGRTTTPRECARRRRRRGAGVRVVAAARPPSKK